MATVQFSELDQINRSLHFEPSSKLTMDSILFRGQLSDITDIDVAYKQVGVAIDYENSYVQRNHSVAETYLKVKIPLTVVEYNALEDADVLNFKIMSSNSLSSGILVSPQDVDGVTTSARNGNSARVIYHDVLSLTKEDFELDFLGNYYVAQKEFTYRRVSISDGRINNIPGTETYLPRYVALFAQTIENFDAPAEVSVFYYATYATNIARGA